MLKLRKTRPFEKDPKKRCNVFVIEHRAKLARKPFVIAFYSVSVLLISFIVFTNVKGSSGNEYIYKKFYDRYDERSRFNNKYLTAIKSYYANKPQETIQLLLDFIQTDSLNTAFNFYLALSYSDCKEYRETISLLEKIVDEKDEKEESYYHPANWYLGLTYLKVYETKKARIVFDKMIKEKSPYIHESLEILELLDKPN